jgi:O-antigen/teichoic acid export membrane protein
MKHDLLRLGKDSVTYGAGSVLTRFIGLLTLPLLTRYLSPTDLGVLAMLALMGMVAQPIFSLGLSAAMGPSYFEKSSTSNKSKVVWSAFCINSVSAFVLVFIAWMCPAFLGKFANLSNHYILLVSLSLTGTAITILATAFTQSAQFEDRARLFVGISLATTSLTILLSVYTVVFLGWGVSGMIYGQLAGNILYFIAFLVTTIRSTTPSFSLRTAKQLLALGLPLVPSFAFLLIIMQSNKYILQFYWGLDTVGIYSVGFNIGMAMSIVTTGISTAWYPFFMSFSGRKNDTHYVFSNVFTFYLYVAGICCLSFFLFAKPVIFILTAVDYHYASHVVGFVALAYFIQMVFNLLLPNLYYYNDVKYVSVIQGLSVLLYLPMSIGLIQRFSIMGACISLVLGNSILVALIFLWNAINYRRYLHITCDWHRGLRIVCLFSFCLLVYYCTPESHILFEFLKSATVLLISAGLAFLSLKPNERAFLARAIQRTILYR